MEGWDSDKDLYPQVDYPGDLTYKTSQGHKPNLNRGKKNKNSNGKRKGRKQRRLENPNVFGEL